MQTMALAKISRATGTLIWKKHATCDTHNYLDTIALNPDVIYHTVSNKIYMAGTKAASLYSCIGVYDNSGAIL